MNAATKWPAQAPARLKQLVQTVELLPVRHTLRGYNRASFRADLQAGVNGALVAFPQGVACAAIAGLPLIYGLVGSALASILGPVFSRSRFVVMGPTNATAVLLLSAFLASGVADESARALLMALLVLMVGVLQVVAAYLNVGSLVAYISRSVIVGYISAAVVLIISNQADNLLGIAVPDSGTLLGVMEGTIANLTSASLPTVGVAVATAAILLALRRFAPKLPHIALTLVASAGLGWLAHALDQEVAMLPAVSAMHWTFTLPVLDLAGINRLASAALAIAFLSVLETASVGKLLAARAGERFNANQETFALGMANIGCALGGGMPASGSPTRSMLNFTSGAASPAASIVCGIATIVLVLGLGTLLQFIPRASLATVVVIVAAGLFHWRQIVFVVRSTSADAVVFAVTTVAALLFPLDAAIFIGTATSIILYLRQAGEPELVEYAFNPSGQLAAVGHGENRPLPEISIVHVEGSLFFGAAELLQEQIRRVCEDANLRIIVLRLKHAHHLDASTILALEELVQFMRENGRGLIVSGARKEVFRICKRTGLLDLIGRENFFVEWPHNPTLSTRHALKRAQQILGQKEADVRVFGETRMRAPDAPGGTTGA